MVGLVGATGLSQARYLRLRTRVVDVGDTDEGSRILVSPVVELKSVGDRVITLIKGNMWLRWSHDFVL